DQQERAAGAHARHAAQPPVQARPRPRPGLHRGRRARRQLTMNARVVLQPRRAPPVYGRPPLVVAGAVAAGEGGPADGDVVDLVAHAHNFVARGLYNGKSKIRVRLYSWDEAADLDEAFFRRRLEAALKLRQLLGLGGPGRACRLVFSEGDGLSGLTVD